ncbi:MULTISPECIES: sulfurtransferase TusA family protein [Acidianus]|uniref:UPF0033 domain-containing protein n=1 Tax=Candidatus Acidianus copahuensis TaxID=1160895 RepID=A0A031LPI5_9CREN|nr:MULTISPECIES: sulfurtransferase TusA family protein [Acidianus]EZQ06896.1 hypothetical protein CM19_05880 [Candidatus Acidianus copahuensis]NON61391.1 sulfurtransferase TusA family protein [Acidianus sp. RZ1]
MKVIDSNDICPVVILTVMREWKSVKDEEEIEIITPWEAVAQELEKWCKETNNEFLGYFRDGDKIKIRLKLLRY